MLASIMHRSASRSLIIEKMRLSCRSVPGGLAEMLRAAREDCNWHSFPQVSKNRWGEFWTSEQKHVSYCLGGRGRGPNEAVGVALHRSLRRRCSKLCGGVLRTYARLARIRERAAFQSGRDRRVSPARTGSANLLAYVSCLPYHDKLSLINPQSEI